MATTGVQPHISLSKPQQRGRFIRRLNRFAVEVELDKGAVQAHLPNSGRMTELLVPGHPVVLVELPITKSQDSF